MTLSKVIIHELIKESESNQTELILSEELIPRITSYNVCYTKLLRCQ